MKLTAIFLLTSGWIIALAAIALLTHGWQIVFIMGGIGVQAIGMMLLFRAHLPERRNLENPR